MVTATVLLALLTLQDPSATVTAVRALVTAQQWEAVDARIQSIPPDDPAWERLPSVLYQGAIAKKDLPWVIDRLSRVVSATSSNANKASALIVIGRAYRRQGDAASAIRSLESAKAAAPGSSYAAEAEGLIYEVKHLSPGLPTPPISEKARSGRTISLAALRGKPVVLVFWGTT